MGEWIDAKAAADVLQGTQLIEARDYQERLRVAALLEEGRFEESEEIFDRIFAARGAEGFSPHLLYTRLVGAGLYEDALRYIDLDLERPARAAFWRGLVYRYRGDRNNATKIWQAALKDELLRGDTESIVEHILTRYYLGDPEGEGVELMLRTQREQPRISWMVFLLTGLGWIVRKDYRAAHSNLRLAVAQVKSMGQGKVLARQYWRFVSDLAPAEALQQFSPYFDIEAEPRPVKKNEEATTTGENAS